MLFDLELSLIIRTLLLVSAALIISTKIYSTCHGLKMKKATTFSVVFSVMVSYCVTFSDILPKGLTNNILVAKVEILQLLKKDKLTEVETLNSQILIHSSPMGLIPEIVSIDANGKTYSIAPVLNDPFFILVSEKNSGVQKIVKGNFFELVRKTASESLVIKVNSKQEIEVVQIKKNQKTIKDFIINTNRRA